MKTEQQEIMELEDKNSWLASTNFINLPKELKE